MNNSEYCIINWHFKLKERVILSRCWMAFFCWNQPRSKSIVVHERVKNYILFRIDFRLARDTHLKISLVKLDRGIPLGITKNNSKQSSVEVVLQILSKFIRRTFWCHFDIQSIFELILFCYMSHDLMISFFIFPSDDVIPNGDALRNLGLALSNNSCGSIFWISVSFERKLVHQSLKIHQQQADQKRNNENKEKTLSDFS